MLGIDLDGLGEIRDRQVGCAFAAVGVATFVVGDGRPGVDFNGFGVVRDGFVCLTLGAVGDAAVGIGNGQLGIEFDELGIVRNRLVVLALGAVGDTPFVVGNGIPGVDPDGLAEVCDRLVGVPLLSERDAPEGVGDGHLLVAGRALADDLRAGGDGLVRIALPAVLPIVGRGRPGQHHRDRQRCKLRQSHAPPLTLRAAQSHRFALACAKVRAGITDGTTFGHRANAAHAYSRVRSVGGGGIPAWDRPNGHSPSPARAPTRGGRCRRRRRRPGPSRMRWR